MISSECSGVNPHVTLHVKDFVGQVIAGGYEDYDGEYEVTPKSEPQILETKHKNMKENVTVKGIPTYEISNEFGGTTFIIGDIK